jgi:ApbE superfamily uncharacterized protein (UPF0280 family)
MSARRTLLADGRRHFQHGPIDLVIGADGDALAVDAAHRNAWARFEGVLEELVGELPSLRQPIDGRCRVRGPIARRMWDACVVHCDRYVTPMAAVAGAIADEIVGFYRRPGIQRAWVNNGGDIAIHLTAGASVSVGLFADLARFEDPASTPDLDGRFTISHDRPVRGIATSGWRGRSFSLGIADSVTVLARTAADADAAATMIANAVDVDDVRIVRRPASMLKDDSDLGELLVTVGVPPLADDTVRRALTKGLRHAEALCADGTIVACALVCQGQMVTTGAHDRSAIAWHATRFASRVTNTA